MSNSFTPENLVLAGYATALLILLTLTVFLLVRFMVSLKMDTPRIESHWGGLGGGLGGWEFSHSLAYLLAAVIFAILSITVLNGAAGHYRSQREADIRQEAQLKNASEEAAKNAASKGAASTESGADTKPADTAKVPAEQTKK